MATQIIEGFVTARKWCTGDYSFHWWQNGSEDYISDQVKIADYNIEIELPDNLDELIHAGKLTALQNKRKLILAENQQRINEIDRKISELLAIENKAE